MHVKAGQTRGSAVCQSPSAREELRLGSKPVRAGQSRITDERRARISLPHLLPTFARPTRALDWDSLLSHSLGAAAAARVGRCWMAGARRGWSGCGSSNWGRSEYRRVICAGGRDGHRALVEASMRPRPTKGSVPPSSIGDAEPRESTATRKSRSRAAR